MSEKSKKSAKGRAIDRPFPPGALAKARKIAAQYQVILACEDGHWYGRGLELPGIHGDGKTVNECVENTREALAGWVACLLEEGRRPPAPAREGARTAQVNIRMTAEEKALLETTAKRKGFSGLSDFVRAAAMELAK
jgi:predicted RNase H-like HicB family nuclease